jgi:hypothetical protein
LISFTTKIWDKGTKNNASKGYNASFGGAVAAISENPVSWLSQGDFWAIKSRIDM